MPADQYHEPPDELSADVRTFARMIASLQEEAEAIGWYEQRISIEPDDQARAIMENAQQEEFKHFAMSLEFLARRNESSARRPRRRWTRSTSRYYATPASRNARDSFSISRAITIRWISCVPS